MQAPCGHHVGMDLRLLEYFVAVVDHGGVTRAAEALYIAQPSLSQAIRTLERGVGTPLFDRTTRGLVLTPAGQDLLGPARVALGEADGARRAVAEVRQLDRGRLDIASVAGLTITPLAELVGTLRTRHPGIVVSIEDPGGVAGVVSAVREGRAEVGVAPLATLPPSAEGLVIEHLWTERIMLAGVTGLLADLPDPLPRDRLRALPMILEVDERLTAADDPELGESIERVVIRCALRATVWDLVGRGAGVTLVPEDLAQRILRRVELRALEPEVRRPAGVILRPGQPSPAATAFVEVARASAVA